MPFKLIKGSKRNFKITTHEDLLLFKDIILSKKKNLLELDLIFMLLQKAMK